MKYTTTNELEHFGFGEVYISEIQKINGCFQFTLNNVTIYPNNSQNRDIREMRANDCVLSIQNGEISALIEEGYKVYNADGKLMEQFEDKPVRKESCSEVLKSLADGECCIFSLVKSRNEKQDKYTYAFAIDASNDRTYLLMISGTGDREEWNRFLNKQG